MSNKKKTAIKYRAQTIQLPDYAREPDAAEKEKMSKIWSIQVISEGSLFRELQGYWYIGIKEYNYLVSHHWFKYLTGLISLRLHCVNTEWKILRKIGLPETYQGFRNPFKVIGIDTLPEEIGALDRLVTLDLAYTHIRRLPDEVACLKKLQYLLLESSSIEEIPSWIGSLKKLKTVTLSGLKLRAIPEELIGLNLPFKGYYMSDSWEEGIFISDLVLKAQPVSLFLQPRALIEDYYRQPHLTVNKAKIIFLGSEGVGKTHTIQRICNSNHKITQIPKETPGISITPMDFTVGDESYHINFWDFGGQAIMHAMHRCFLTERTGYVVVVSTRHGDGTAEARSWLRNLRSFAKYAPVVVFVNVWNDGTYYGVDEDTLRHEFPNIIDVVHCSAKDSKDFEFEKITKSIQKLAEENESITMEFPEKWEDIRQEILKCGEQQYYIGAEKYKEICIHNGVKSRPIQGWLLDWFNDLGECFTYKSGEDILSDNRQSMILNPQWLTNAVYIIVRELGEEAEKGVVSHSKIKKLLDKSNKGTLSGVSYSSEECEYVLEVMRRYQLSYKIPAKEAEFIPSLLHNSPRLFVDEKKVVSCYEMKYDYLPENVLYSLMVEYYRMIDDECWRNQFSMTVRNVKGPEMSAFVYADYERNTLTIEIIRNADKETWELLQALRDKVMEINDHLNLMAQDFIIVGSKDENGESERVSVKRLLRLQDRGLQDFQAFECGWNINALLGKVYGEELVREVRKEAESNSDITIDSILSKLGKQGARQFLSLKIKAMLNIDDIHEYIMKACAQIQARKDLWKEPDKDVPEDVRNDEMRDLLRSRDLIVHDQTHAGHGEGYKNPGEVDLMIMKAEAQPMTLIEAMNLSGVKENDIRKHLNKLVDGYNDSGLKELFLISYVEVGKNNFNSFWKRYERKVRILNGDRFAVDTATEPEIQEGVAWIKNIKLAYDFGEQRFWVHHICVRVMD